MSNNLKELIKLAGIKQEALGKEMGVSQAIVSHWANNRYSPSVENLILLSKILGVSTDCILGLKPIPEGYPDCYVEPVFYSDAIKNQAVAAEEGRLYKPPKQKKAPFTKEQIDYLEEMEDRIVDKVTGALKEDTLLLKETEPEAK